MGQWKARVARLQSVIDEISEAEECASNGEEPLRPRAGINPSDQELRLVEPTTPPERFMRKRRRTARLHSPRLFPRRQVAVEVCGLDHVGMERAEEELRKLEDEQYPVMPDAFAHRIGVPALHLYNTVAICERLWAHNRKCSEVIEQRPVVESRQPRLPKRSSDVPKREPGRPGRPAVDIDEVEAVMARFLEQRREEEQRVDHDDLAALCGVKLRQFFIRYPTWCHKVKEHNRAIEDNLVVRRAEARLKDLTESGTAENTKAFAKSIGSDPGQLRRRCPELVHALCAHNKTLNFRGSHFRLDDDVGGDGTPSFMDVLDGAHA